MIDAGVITVDLLLAPESRPGDLRVRRASLLNERTLNLMDRLARSLGSCREVVPLVFSLCPCAHLVTLDAAERAAAGLAEDERRTVDGCLAERALMLEALLENIRVLALDASKLVCVPVQADSLAAYAKARAGFSGVIRTLQGFNLVTGQVDEDALLEAHRLIDRLTADCEGLLASLVFGISPEAFLEMTEPVPCPQPSVRWTARLYRNPMSSTFRILPTRCTTGSGMKPTSRPSPFTAAGPRLREHS